MVILNASTEVMRSQKWCDASTYGTVEVSFTQHYSASDYLRLYYEHDGATTVDITGANTTGSYMATFLEATLMKAD